MPDGLRTARHFLWDEPSQSATIGSSLRGFRQVPPQALRASSPKGTPLRDAGSFIATPKSRPLEGRLPPLRGKMSRSDKRGSVA